MVVIYWMDEKKTKQFCNPLHPINLLFMDIKNGSCFEIIQYVVSRYGQKYLNKLNLIGIIERWVV